MAENERGRLIVLEGGDGAGKTTQIELLRRWFDELGLRYESSREPGGTEVGELIRDLVLKRVDLEMPAETELFLILAARAAFVQEVVLPVLNCGDLFLSDRFDLSTFAYQGFGRGLNLAEVKRANALATHSLEPDLYLVLDVPPEIGAKRRLTDIEGNDRIEGGGEGFLNRVREGYLELAESMPNVVVVDGVGTPEEIHIRVRRALTERFPETFPGT